MSISNESLEYVQKKVSTPAVNLISVGITWIDGRVLFKQQKKWSKSWYGICNYSAGVWAITPLDYSYPLMTTTIQVSPTENYCEKAYSCLHFQCPMNKFNKNVYLTEFKDCGAFTLGLPLDIGSKPLWFNDGKYKTVWKSFIISPEGGRLEYSEEKANKTAG
ncbi:MAG: hypothetical protein WC346_18910 [Methanogenium sp.]|jgi:hypothetical protein